MSHVEIIRACLALVTIVGFYLTGWAVLCLVRAGSISPPAATIVGMLLGYSISEAKQVLSFYFGRSSGSKYKDDLLSDKKL